MKELLRRNKSVIGCFVVTALLGYFSTVGNMPTEEYNALLSKGVDIEQQISQADNEIVEAQKEVDKLQEEKDEKERLAKIEAEKKAEEERKAAEEKRAQEEAEKKAEAERKAEEERLAKESQTSSGVSGTYSGSGSFVNTTPSGQMVWISETGSKYHRKNNCGRMNPSRATQMTLSEAQSRGYSACKKCY